MSEMENTRGANFIEDIINEDLKNGVYTRVQTRFPPEPNGYLHVGHAKAICINFSIAQKYGGICNLRFDDTNPVKEDTEYVDSIMEDIRWLGYEWDKLFYASEYFDELYGFAEKLIMEGKAFVCDLTADEIKEYRGTLTQPGRESPYRNRPAEESLDLFRRMKAGEFKDGERVLRAKIDMASPNVNMRDPVIYRIMHAHHHRTGDKWCIYPMYDFAHPLSDAVERVTFSLCSLEFEDHRPLYEWCVDEVGFEEPPRQIEFARLGLTRTVMSKRYLKKLVDENIVSGWDDPRMPTLCGLRRRGYTPESIRDFCERIGVAKANSTVDVKFLEHCVREDLNERAIRAMAVLKPLKITITNYPEGEYEMVEAENHPMFPERGTRMLKFGRTVYIEQDDFMEHPVRKFFRLKPGGEVRLKNAYIIMCEDVIKDEDGNVTELLCTYDPASKSGNQSRKVKGTLHWVGEDAQKATIRRYDYLLLPDTEDLELTQRFNKDSIEILENCLVEPMLEQAEAGERFQFMRQGYFIKDMDSTEEMPVFNEIVGLKDSWAKVAK